MTLNPLGLGDCALRVLNLLPAMSRLVDLSPVRELLLANQFFGLLFRIVPETDAGLEGRGYAPSFRVGPVRYADDDEKLPSNPLRTPDLRAPVPGEGPGLAVRLLMLRL